MLYIYLYDYCQVHSTRRHMMATAAAVVGLSSTGKRLLSSSLSYSDITDKLFYLNDHGFVNCQLSSTKNVVTARKSSSNYSNSRFPSSNRHHEQAIRALQEHVDTASAPSSATHQLLEEYTDLEEESSDLEYSVEALLLLQKSMLEKQWNLCFEKKLSTRKITDNKIPVTCSGVSARQRRISTKRKAFSKNTSELQPSTNKYCGATISPSLLQNRTSGYVKGVTSEHLLTHTEVVRLSKKIKIGLSVEEHKSRLYNFLLNSSMSNINLE